MSSGVLTLNSFQKPYRIALVGEAWGEEEAGRRLPFVGSAGRFLNPMLSMAGIDRRECLVTNVLNMRPPGNDLMAILGPKSNGLPGYPAIAKGKYLPAELGHHIERLFAELRDFQPNVIVALGNTALWALTKKSGIKKFRGAPLWDHTHSWEVLPTYHPAAVMREYKLRPITIADLSKAARHGTEPGFVRPSRLIYMEPSIEDLYSFYDEFIAPVDEIASDVETLARQITMVSFAPRPDRVLVIPFWQKGPQPNYWSVKEEVAAIRFCEFVYQTKRVIGQNFLYDTQYWWRTFRIAMSNLADDTMLMHHAQQPEMIKDLGALGSFYTDEPAWKFMRNDTIKAED